MQGKEMLGKLTSWQFIYSILHRYCEACRPQEGFVSSLRG